MKEIMRVVLQEAVQRVYELRISVVICHHYTYHQSFFT